MTNIHIDPVLLRYIGAVQGAHLAQAQSLFEVFEIHSVVACTLQPSSLPASELSCIST